MAAYPQSEILPSVEVDATQFHFCVGRVKDLLQQANFVAIDAEFSGLGAAAFSARISDLEERYKVLRSVAMDYSLVSFGMSIFEKNPFHSDERSEYRVSNFNFMLSRHDDYKVTPRSLVFLIENGLDLQKHILLGIPYTPSGGRVRLMISFMDGQFS
jgi:hypothetical protein